MKKILFWIWQLPQNIAGFILSRFASKSATRKNIYFMRLFRAGVSLGDYIILDPIHIGDFEAYNHEKGHQAQSRILGPFYLLVVGLPSIIRNIYLRTKGEAWSPEKQVKWYYGAFPENWADKLGGVER
jgi:hypothetical protein